MTEQECRALLTTLLEDSGVQWVQYGVWIRFRFRDGRMVWEIACRCAKDAVLIYCRYPMRIRDAGAALAVCNRANSRLLHGAMFTREGVPAFRICVDMRDPYGARERVAQTLEYSAAVVVQYWGELQNVCCALKNPVRYNV